MMTTIPPEEIARRINPKPEQCEWDGYEGFKRGCGEILHPKVARYSLNAFGKYLCIKHQKLEREKTQPKKMAEFLNKAN